MKFVLDLHTHTLASGHAYNTIREMARSAADKGLELLGITEHAVGMAGTCDIIYFHNLKMVERNLYGVELLLGAELNILDTQGSIDMEDELLKKMDVTIASMHLPSMISGNREENTFAYLQVMKNPYINMIGHPDDGRYPVDYLALVQAAKEYHVLLEVNNNSLDPRCTRINGETNITTMLNHCRKYQVPVVISSDAHTDTLVGCHAYAERLMKEIDFPEDLVLNHSAAAVKKFLNQNK